MDLLFVGNSYTFYNNLDEMSVELWAAGEQTLAAERIAEPGYSFPDHLAQMQTTGTAWEAELVNGAWQGVMLQDQSQIPGFPQTNSERRDSEAALVAIDAALAAQGATSMLLLTWGRRDGDADNPELYPDFSTMQGLLTEGYLAYQAAISTDERPAFVAPVGLAWQRVYEESADPTDPEGLFWSLYVDDGSHPSAKGSYLAACVIYASWTGRSPEGLPTGLEDGAELQRIAAQTVFDDTVDWAYPWSGGGGDTGGEDTGGDDTDAEDTDAEDTAVGDSNTDGSKISEGACGCSGGAGTGWFGVVGAVGAVWGRRRAKVGVGFVRTCRILSATDRFWLPRA